MMERISETFDEQSTAVLVGLTTLAVLFLAPIHNYNSKSQIKETPNARVFISSIETDFSRGYDFNRDGLLDRIKESSFSYRPTHLRWHSVDRNTPYYLQVQNEYSDLLKNKSR